MWPFKKPGVYETTDRTEIDSGIRSFQVRVTKAEYRVDALRRLREHLGGDVYPVEGQRLGRVYRFRLYPGPQRKPERRLEMNDLEPDTE